MFGLSAVSPAFYYALAAVGVPVVIHFLFKARKQEVEFSSIDFILTSTVLKSSRMRFKELLLLLLRVATVALITLAFARLFLRRDVSAFGLLGRTDLVMLLDDSYSMRYREARQTRFAGAVARAKDVLAKCRGGDRVGVVLASRPQAPALKLSPNFDAARRLLDAAKPTFRTSVLAAALERGVAMLRNSTADQKVVFILSDFQESTWGYVSNVLAKLPADVKIKTASVAHGDAANVAVLGARAVRDAFTPGHSVQMMARVANYSAAPAPGLDVTLAVDGQPKGQKALSLKPREVREVAFSFVAPDKDSLACEVRVRPSDQLPADDALRCVISQSRPIRVLCIEDKVADVPYFQKTFYLRTALDPTAETLKSVSSVRTTLIELAQFHKTAAAGFDVIVLADLPGLSESQADSVEAFVRSGGGLVVFLGPNVEPAIYNKVLFKNGAGVLPARLVDIVETLGKGQEYYHLGAIEMGHPIFEIFSKPYSGDLTVPRFNGLFKVDTAPCPEAQVLASYDNDMPAVVTRKLGLGKCVLVTSTADTKWTNFPKHMVFVPLMHQIVKYVSPRQAEDRPRFDVGERAVIPRDLVAQAAGVVVSGPDKRERRVDERAGEPTGYDNIWYVQVCARVDVRAGEPTVFADTSLPGVYVVDAVFGETGRRVPIWKFAVVLATVESDLRPAAPSRIASLSARSATKAVAVEEAADIAAHEGELPPDVWRYLFIAALACMAVELLIANRGQA